MIVSTKNYALSRFDSTFLLKSEEVASSGLKFTELNIIYIPYYLKLQYSATFLEKHVRTSVTLS